LELSIAKESQKYLFNISGVMNGIQPNFIIKDLSLMNHIFMKIDG
jgi:hypothetical protein